jgi:dTDP-glucose 4,6-dehydratase
MKNMLVTGVTGFIGSHLCNWFKHTFDVSSFSNHARVSDLFPDDLIEDAIGDVVDFSDIYKYIYYADTVIHCAGITGIDNVLSDPYKALKSNIIGAFNVLEAVAISVVKHCIMFSSGESLGTNTNIHKEFTQLPLYDDRWCYGLGKLVSEYASISSSKKGLPVTVVRPFNVYGPGQVGGGAIKTFILQALKNEPITIHGDGSQARSWCYVDDFAYGIWQIIQNTDKTVGRVFNIGNSDTIISILNLALLIKDILGSTSDIKFIEAPFVDVEYRVPDISNIKELGFYNYTNLETGILKTIEWFNGKL